MINICSLNTGKEIGAMNYLEHYLEGTIPFIRVSTLKDNIYDIYCEPKNVALCKINDILISFDGTPGRIGYGLSGAYSSGMKKVECDPKNKGLIYFYFRTEKCQNKILEHKKGSVIPHFSTSIPELKIPLFDVQVTIILNNLFNILVMLRQKINILQVVKQVLLDKYFK
ncbi:restriction endonuclease subunit S [Metamycoplasma salivarium]|uniref:restriction endonuclease subunit S n=1 Tax=Metamycoplasma salivarium TaxID=2124 RepID=UPI003570DDCC